jgi:hypothetical protein
VRVGGGSLVRSGVAADAEWQCQGLVLTCQGWLWQPERRNGQCIKREKGMRSGSLSQITLDFQVEIQGFTCTIQPGEN